MAKTPRPSARSQYGLDWLNFLIADVETGFGPFVSVYLAANGWSPGTIGTVLTLNSTAGLLSRTPAGALIDATTWKRAVAAGCLALIAGGALLIALAPSFLVVGAAELVHGVAGGTAQTVLVAIGLGLVGHKAFGARIGRNHRYKALGNALTAGAMGALGEYLSPAAPFYAAALLCVPALGALWLIRPREIDHARARASKGKQDGREKGREDGNEDAPAAWRQVFTNRRLLVIAGALFLFQFANASMLPLASERLAADGQYRTELITAALVVVPQLVTAALAGVIAAKADGWGRKSLLLIGFASLLLRAGLFAVDLSPWFLVAIQALGGFTAAVIGILIPLVVSDVTRRSGRFNAALGATNTVGAIGASVSTAAVGYVAQLYGFLVGFGLLAAVAGAGLALLFFKLPETVEESREEN